MTNQKSQDIDINVTETGFRYHRGSALSIFKSDRTEDVIALVCALAIALGIWAHVNLDWSPLAWIGL
jgi:hypothetical protein